MPSADDANAFEARVQAQVDEVEFLFASLGETTGYIAYAEHTERELARNGGLSLTPADPTFWRAVAEECRRRDAGVVTPFNAARLDRLEE